MVQNGQKWQKQTKMVKNNKYGQKCSNNGKND